MQSSTASDTTAWYLIHSKPRQEHIALINLERQGYTCYLPLLRVEKIRRRKAEVVSEPMFARYLFVRLSTSDNGPSWAPIRATLGVSQLVRFGTRPAKVEDPLVDLLRNRELAQPTKPLFSQGDTVVITEGPFAGLEAAYQMANADQRAMVLLHLLSQPVPVKIDFTEIKVSRAQIGGRTASKVACRPTSRVSNSTLWHRAVAAIKASGNFARPCHCESPKMGLHFDPCE